MTLLVITRKVITNIFLFFLNETFQKGNSLKIENILMLMKNGLYVMYECKSG